MLGLYIIHGIIGSDMNKLNRFFYFGFWFTSNEAVCFVRS